MDKLLFEEKLKELGVLIKQAYALNDNPKIIYQNQIKCPRCSEMVDSDLVEIQRDFNSNIWKNRCMACKAKWFNEYIPFKTEKRFRTPMSEEANARRRENARLYAAKRRAEAKKAKQK